MHLHVKKEKMLCTDPFALLDYRWVHTSGITDLSHSEPRASSHICHLLVSGSQVGATERGHTGQHIQVCKSAVRRMLSGPLCLVASRFY